MFETIYTKICTEGKSKKSKWVPGSGLHRHHILPLHHGGMNSEENFTYLTVRAHRVAHYLLWRIHRKVNDLRAMHMLGANLTPGQRVTVGKWCRDNKIGFFADRWSAEEKYQWVRKGISAQIKNGVGIFDPQKRPEYASLGGKKGSRSQIKDGIAIFDCEKRPYYAHLGGISHRGKFWIHNKKGEVSRCSPEDLESKLQGGWEKGMKRPKTDRSISKWMHRGTDEKKVKNEMVQESLRLGWKLGRNPKVGERISSTKRSFSSDGCAP
jgi:hypothetical protein